ncbi:MAG: SPOR domain-containing protein [Treponema sp.]|nr:SPOR domain-containing protein [Treponema sp.]
MEKKKLLLIAVSVGTALFFMIGIPLLLINPGDGPETQYAVGSYELPSVIELPPPSFPEDNFAIAEIPEMDTLPIPPEEINYSEPEYKPEAATITGNKPQTAGVPNITSVKPTASKPVAIEPAPEKPASVKPAQNKPAAVAEKPAVQEKPVTQGKAAAKEPVKVPENKESPKEISRNDYKNYDYWIQAGAFSAKVTAENAKETLNANGVKSIIENREVNGKTWYRVRVGPYISENEAKFWLPLVKSIDGFGTSMIFLTQADR